METMPFGVALTCDIEAIVMDGECRRLRWATVERYLASKYKVSVPQLRRAAPWAERVYREQRTLMS